MFGLRKRGRCIGRGELKTPSGLINSKRPIRALVLHMKKKLTPMLITAAVAIAAVYVWNNFIVPKVLQGKGTA